MSRKPLEPNDFLPFSNLSFHILLALGEGPSHGYAMGKDVEQRSGGRLRPTTGGLYQALRRLGEDGLIERFGHPGGVHRFSASVLPADRAGPRGRGPGSPPAP